MASSNGIMAAPPEQGGSGVNLASAKLGKSEFEGIVKGGKDPLYAVGDPGITKCPPIPSAEREDALMNQHLGIHLLAGQEYDPDDCQSTAKAIGKLIDKSTDNNTTYTLSAPTPDPNDPLICITTLTGSDGSVQEIIVNKPILETDGVHVNGVSFDETTNIFTFTTVNDADESAAAPISVNLSPLVSDPILFTGGNNVTITFNAATNEYTFDAVDTNTTVRYIFTNLPDGTTNVQEINDAGAPIGAAQIIGSEARITDAEIELIKPADSNQDGIEFNFSVTEDGNVTSSSSLVIPYATENSEGLIEIASASAELNVCEPKDNTRAVTPLGLDTWMNRGHQFNSAGFTASNICDKSVIASTDATVGGIRSSVISSDNVQALGATSHIAASQTGVNITAAGIAAAIIASQGAGTVDAISGGLYSVRSTDGVNGHALIQNGWSAGIASLNPRLGTNSTALYNFAGGTADVICDFNYSYAMGSVRTASNDVRAGNISSVDCINNGSNSVILGSTSVQNEDSNSLVMGNGTGPASTTNRTIVLSSVTGDINISGALTAGVVFAGFGEKAIGSIEEYKAVRFEGKAGVRLAEVGEKPHGVTTKRLAISAGGGFDPDNYPFLIDADGAPLLNSEGERIVNEDYDSSVKLDTSCVEMLGRTFIDYSSEPQIGQFIGSGGDIVESSLGFEVLSVDRERNKAFVLVK